MIDWTKVHISGIVDEIETAPSIVQEMPAYILEHLLNWCNEEDSREFVLFNQILVVNPDRDNADLLRNYHENLAKIQAIRDIARAEQERRNPDPFKVAQKEKAARIGRHFNQLIETPAYVSEMKPFELQEMETYLDNWQPPTDPDFVKPYLETRQKLLAAVQGELAHLASRPRPMPRQESEPAPAYQATVPTSQKSEPEQLTFEKIWADETTTSELWKILSTANPPVTSTDGQLILEGENRVGCLVALSNALSSRCWFAKGVRAYSAYRALCAHWNLKPSPRPDKAKKRHGYQDCYDNFIEILPDAGTLVPLVPPVPNVRAVKV